MNLNIEPQVIICNGYARMPEYATDGSAAMDLYPSIGTDVVVQPGETRVFSTGLKIWVNDPNVCCLCLPRSGLGTKHGMILANTVGLIDSDYQGEWKIAIYNRSKKAYRLTPKDAIAQALFTPVVKVTDFNVVNDFVEETVRGEGGFGSTDKNNGSPES